MLRWNVVCVGDHYHIQTLCSDPPVRFLGLLKAFISLKASTCISNIDLSSLLLFVFFPKTRSCQSYILTVNRVTNLGVFNGFVAKGAELDTAFQQCENSLFLIRNSVELNCV